MFQNICSYPADSDIVAAALHPLRAQLTIGLVNGWVESFDLSHGGGNMIASLWKTKRHKGTCRCIAYSPDGKVVYSAGIDSVVKQFDAATGQVCAKIAVPYYKSQPDMPVLLHVVGAQSLLLATDSGRLHVYDLANKAPSSCSSLPLRPVKTLRPHGSEYVSSIAALPATASLSAAPRMWVSTGGTHLAVTDLPTAKVVRSEDQEDELLSCLFVPGLGPKGKRNNGVVVVGTGDGFLTLWDKGAWDDQLDRINVCAARRSLARHAEAIDALARVPDALQLGKAVVCGLADGSLEFVNVETRAVLRDLALRHDGVEGVVFVGFDEQNRLVSIGGASVKIWQDLSELEPPSRPRNSSSSSSSSSSSDDDDDHDHDHDDDNEDNANDGPRVNGKKHKAHSPDSDSDSANKAPPMKRKKTRNLGPMGAHGVLGFEDMD